MVGAVGYLFDLTALGVADLSMNCEPPACSETICKVVCKKVDYFFKFFAI
jgi:hypothetical protein